MIFTQTELLIAVIAGLLEGCRHVAVGAASPIPGAGALLARQRCGGAMRVSVLGSTEHNAFTNGGVELFDLAAEGRIDAFFLGGGQIDGSANINLVGAGSYPTSEVRWPGSFGSAYLYYLVPRVILFREEHTRRVLVPKVDFVSAPGVSNAGVYRPGGPYALLTGLALFMFDRERRRVAMRRHDGGHPLRPGQRRGRGRTQLGEGRPGRRAGRKREDDESSAPRHPGLLGESRRDEVSPPQLNPGRTTRNPAFLGVGSKAGN